jgi:hypothetical protein
MTTMSRLLREIRASAVEVVLDLPPADTGLPVTVRDDENPVGEPDTVCRTPHSAKVRNPSDRHDLKLVGRPAKGAGEGVNKDDVIQPLNDYCSRPTRLA